MSGHNVPSQGEGSSSGLADRCRYSSAAMLVKRAGCHRRQPRLQLCLGVSLGGRVRCATRVRLLNDVDRNGRYSIERPNACRVDRPGRCASGFEVKLLFDYADCGPAQTSWSNDFTRLNPQVRSFRQAVSCAAKKVGRSSAARRNEARFPPNDKRLMTRATDKRTTRGQPGTSGGRRE